MAVKNGHSFPWKIQELESEIAEERKKFFNGETFVRVGPKGYIIQDEYKKFAAAIYNLPLRSSDIFILGYPRSGTTMTQELVWLLANNLEFEKARSISMVQRVPYLEMSVTLSPECKQRVRKDHYDDEDFLSIMEWTTQPVNKLMAGLPSPRVVKSHIPLSLLPPDLLYTSRVVYVARDPRDVAVSHYHLMKDSMMVDYVGDFKTYWKFFIKDANVFTPYFEHVKEAWEHRNHPHMLFLFYEELSKDLPATVSRAANFLGKQLSKEQLGQLCQHLNFENFKKNKSVNDEFTNKLYGLVRNNAENTFIRKGKAGGWRDHFDEELAKQAEQWLADNLRDTDLRFPHIQY